MSLQLVNIGSAPNDGNGTPLRDAFDMINDNFLEVYLVNSGVVRTTGNQVISGGKTFSTTTIFNGGIITATISNALVNGASIDLTSTAIYDGAAVQSIDWGTRILTDSAGGFVLDWENREAIDATSTSSINWANRQLRNTSAQIMLDWESALLYDGSSQLSIDWVNRSAADTSTTSSLSWGSRELFDSNGITTLDWGNSLLTGNWQTNTIPTLGTHIVNRNFLQTGTYNLPLVVRQTGTQTVSGRKVFVNTTYFPSGLEATTSIFSGAVTIRNILGLGVQILDITNSVDTNLDFYVTAPGVSPGYGRIAPSTNTAIHLGILGTDYMFIRPGGVVSIGDGTGTLLVTNSGNRSTLSGLWVANTLQAPTHTGRIDLDTMRLYENDGNYNVAWDSKLLRSFNIDSIDWGNRTLVDASSNISVEWHNRILYGNGGMALSWTQRQLYDTSELTSLDWSTRQTYDSSGFASLDWEYGAAYVTGFIRMDWNSCALYGTGGIDTFHWNDRLLSGNWQTNTVPTLGTHLINRNYLQTGNLFLVVRQTGDQNISGTKTFINGLTATAPIFAQNVLSASTSMAVDLINGNLNDSLGTTAMAWEFRLGYDSVGDLSIDYNARLLHDSAGGTAINWTSSRYLAAAGGTPTLYFGSNQITGQWTFQSMASTVTSGTTAVTKVIDWSTASNFKQPITGTGISFSFTNTREGQTIHIVTVSTGNSLIMWPTGTAGIPILWPGNFPFSGTSGSAAQPKRDVFSFLRVNNEIYASYGANYYR